MGCSNRSVPLHLLPPFLCQLCLALSFLFQVRTAFWLAHSKAGLVEGELIIRVFFVPLLHKLLVPLPACCSKCKDAFKSVTMKSPL
jgi:hypothetical protein